MSSMTIPAMTAEPAAGGVEGIFQEHYPFVYRTAFGVTGTPEDAEDVVQTIFLRLLRREIPPDLTKNPRAYLYRAAVNLSLNTVRARQRRTLTGDVDGFEVSVHSSAPSRAEEIHRKLYEAIAELGTRAAEILILRYVHNCSDAEIAKLLGTSRGTIAVNLYRSRVRLKALLRSSLGDES
jgi:RNA polymerase sigma-70 factor (ECF subfamily)